MQDHSTFKIMNVTIVKNLGRACLLNQKLIEAYCGNFDYGNDNNVVSF